MAYPKYLRRLEELLAFWAAHLGIPGERIRLQRKSNTSGLKARTWRCRHGVFTIAAYDTYFRARLEAWMDQVKEEWLYTRPLGA
jgi:hypothetical protein